MRPTSTTPAAEADVQGTVAGSAAPHRTPPLLTRLREPRLVAPLALLLLTASLLPVIHAPFFGDDLTGSEVHGYLRLTGESLWNVIAESTRQGVIEGGRPQLLSNVTGNSLFAVMGGHAGPYHGYLLGMTVVDAALLFVLLRRLGWGVASAALPIVLVAGLMQLRIYHDSLLSYVGLMQILLAITLASTLFFLRWLREGRRGDFLWAAGMFVLCPLIYEVTYSFFVVYVAIALTERRGRSALKAAAPFVVICVVFAVASFVLRAMATASLEAYNPGGGPWTILRTYFIQLFPPLPASNLLFDPSLGGDATPAELAGALWRAVAVAVAVAAAAVAFARRPPTSRVAGAVALGLALWLAPPAMLSLAPKYQVELGPGRGYLPVLMQVFGLAVLFTVAIRFAVARAAARSAAMLALTIVLLAGGAGLTAGITGFNNLRVVAMIQPDRESRNVFEDAAGRGAFASMPARSSLLFWDSDLLWIGPVPYRGYPYPPMMLADKTRREYDTRLESATQPETALNCPHAPTVVQQPCAALDSDAAWVRVRVRRDGGTVIIAPFRINGATGRRAALVARQITVYRESDQKSAQPARLIGATGAGRPWDSSAATWRRLKSGSDWALYSVDLGSGPRPTAGSLDDDLGIVNWNTMPAPPLRVRLLGVRQILP